MAIAQVLTSCTLHVKHPSMGKLSDTLINYLVFAMLTNSSFSSPNYNMPSNTQQHQENFHLALAWNHKLQQNLLSYETQLVKDDPGLLLLEKDVAFKRLVWARISAPAATTLLSPCSIVSTVKNSLHTLALERKNI